MLFLVKLIQSLRQWWWLMYLICMKKEQTTSAGSGFSRKYTQREKQVEKEIQCEIPVIQADSLYVALCRAPLRLMGRSMATLWTSWGLYCLSWTGTVWRWWTEELWLCGWRRWEVSAFLKRRWEILVPCSLRKTCSGKTKTHNMSWLFILGQYVERLFLKRDLLAWNIEAKTLKN